MKTSSESFTSPITVVIADDHPVVREGLVEVFKSHTDIKVVAEDVLTCLSLSAAAGRIICAGVSSSNAHRSRSAQRAGMVYRYTIRIIAPTPSGV
jgi:hypothetical protein